MFGSLLPKHRRYPTSPSPCPCFCSLSRRQAEEEVARTREDEEVGLASGWKKNPWKFRKDKKKQPDGHLLTCYKWSYKLFHPYKWPVISYEIYNHKWVTGDFFTHRNGVWTLLLTDFCALLAGGGSFYAMHSSMDHWNIKPHTLCETSWKGKSYCISKASLLGIWNVQGWDHIEVKPKQTRLRVAENVLRTYLSHLQTSCS